MFSGLKKLFGETPAPAAAKPAAREASATPAKTPENEPFLRRETVFDRDGRVCGHLFHLEQSSLLADAATPDQVGMDRILLDMLNASPEAWNTSTAFIPLNSASLALPAVDRLKTENIVLLLRLSAADQDPEAFCERLRQLSERGLQIGLYRQPQHPAFTSAIQLATYAAIDIETSDPNTVRDFSAAIRAISRKHPRLFACRVATEDDHRFCHQWHFEYFQGKFAASVVGPPPKQGSDPHKAQLLNLMRLLQTDAETKEVAQAMKLDPLLSFRILRYMNSAALGLGRKIDSLHQALTILGRQRVARWVAVMLFSVREPQIGDWLLIENALTRGRLMEVLGPQVLPGQQHDPLFLTGIFSCLDRLLHRPMADVLADIPVAEGIREALLKRSGPYAPLLAVAEACEAFDLPRMAATAGAVGIAPDTVNRALLAATAWASEVTEYWE